MKTLLHLSFGLLLPCLCLSQNGVPDTLKSHHLLEFVGDANIQQSISSGSSVLPANTGMGVILIQEFGNKSVALQRFDIRELRVQLGINIASTVDTLEALWKNGGVTNTRDFGTYFMLPLNSRQAASLSFKIFGVGADDPDWRRWSPKTPFWGFFNSMQGSLFASNRALKLSDTLSIQVSAFAIHIGAMHEFMPYNLRRDKQLSLYIGLDFAYRSIGGDLGQKENDALRRELLGSPHRNFFGVGAFGGVQLKNVSAEFNIPFFFPRRDSESGERQAVAGLTGLQLLTRIRFVGGFPLHNFRKP